MFETIAVVLILVFLFVFGIQYYAGVQNDAYKRVSEQFNSLDSIKLANQIISSPQLVCSSNNIRTGLCLDYFKLEVAHDGDYIDVGSAGVKVTVTQTYPPRNQVWTVVDTQIDEDVSSFSSQFPVTIFNQFTLENNFGYMEIITYESTN